MTTFYFTFNYNSPNRNKYVRVEAKDREAARRIMIDQRGLQWGFQYSEEEFLPQIAPLGLKETPL